MRLFDLFEDKLKTAVIGFGRMNPPTTGHGVLVNAINSKAKEYGGDPMLFLTMTHTPYLTDKTQKLRPWDKVKNPLQWKQKLGYAQKFFDIPISTDPSLNTIMAVMKSLETKGYEKVVLVCGSDRVKEFETQVLPYNNTPDQSGNIAFNIKEVSVEEGGFRDEEADDASGMSASKMREAAANNDFESFKQGVPVESLAKKMFDDVRQGLGMNHQKQTEDLTVKQQRPKLDVIYNIADRKDSKPFPLSYKDTGGASTGGMVYITPDVARKFVSFYEKRADDEQQLMQKALKSVSGLRNLFKNIGLGDVEVKMDPKTEPSVPKNPLDALLQSENATVVKPMGGAPIKRSNPVAKNANATIGGGGAGAHRDKKKDAKRGYQKHKGSYESIAEGWHDIEVLGHKYMPDIEEYDDNRKIWHTIVTPQGKTIDADFTPYSYMDKEDLTLYIKLKYPRRKDLGMIGPLDKEDLQKMANNIGIAKLDPEMANAGTKEDTVSEGMEFSEVVVKGNNVKIPTVAQQLGWKTEPNVMGREFTTILPDSKPLTKDAVDKFIASLGLKFSSGKHAKNPFAPKTNEEEYDTQRDRDAVSGKPRKSYFTPSKGKMSKDELAKARERKEKAEKAAVDNIKKALGK